MRVIESFFMSSFLCDFNCYIDFCSLVQILWFNSMMLILKELFSIQDCTILGITISSNIRNVFVPDWFLGGGQKEEIYDGNASQMILNDLVRDRNYEIIVTPFNSQGSGPSSSPVTVYVGEAVPTGSL